MGLSDGGLQAVILAGGLGTRLGSLTKDQPKALVPVNGEPFLAHQLRLLRQGGINDVVLCVGYLGEMIEEFAGKGERFDMRIRYVYDGPKLLGTAGAVRRALPVLGQSFFTVYGDSYLPCDYRDVAAAFQAAGKLGLMTVYRNEGQWDTSNVEYADGRILVYDKANRTPSMRHIDYGLGMFRRDAFLSLPQNTPYDLATLYQDLLREHALAAYEVTERFYEIGSPQGLLDLESRLLLAQ